MVLLLVLKGKYWHLVAFTFEVKILILQKYIKVAYPTDKLKELKSKT